MTIPTSVLSATFFDQHGDPLPGVVITAQLSGLDLHSTTYVTNRFFTGTTDATGAVSLTLYTNSAGLRGTYYNVKVVYQGRVLSDSNVTLSASADLSVVEGNYDGAIVNPPPGNYSITGNLTVTGTLVAGATALASLVLTAPLPLAQGGTGTTNAPDARVNLGLGTMAQQNADAVSITGGLIGGVTVAAIAGATTASGVTNTPAGGIAAVTVQAALNELDTEKVAASGIGTTVAPGTAALASGIVKSTTTTGALSIAVADTDYATPAFAMAMAIALG